MNRLTCSLGTLLLVAPVGIYNAHAASPDITFTTAKVQIQHDSDAGSGSPDDLNCGGIKGGPCDQFNLSAAFTVNNGSDLITDLSTSGNTVGVWLGHNALCTAGQSQAVFHTILDASKGQSHTSKTKQTYKFVGKTNAVDDSNSTPVPLVDLSIQISVNTKNNTGTLTAKGTGEFGNLKSGTDNTIGFALVTNEANDDGDDDSNCTNAVTATYHELDSD